MPTLIILSLIIAGLLLFIVEVFLIPGISVAGIASGVSLLYAVYYAFDTLGSRAGFITLAAIAAGVIGVIFWFMHSKTVDRLALKKTLDYKPNPLNGIKLHVGDQGTALTRLTLIGNAEINGHILEVKSDDGFIDEKTPVQICRICDGTIYVRRIEN